MSINIIFPVLNERLRLEKGVAATVEYLKGISYNSYEITIVDNGSTDETPQIAKRLCRAYPKVRYERIGTRGVGAAFRRGLALNTCDIVGYMDIDLSTDIRHLGETIHMFEECPDVQYVNGSRFSRASHTRGRRWYRQVTSKGLLFLLRVFLGMKCTDAVCGFTFVRRETGEMLAAACGGEPGWFYMIEFLLRAERRGVRIVDCPVEWREDYDTTVKIFRTACNYLKNIAVLFWEFRVRKRY